MSASIQWIVQRSNTVQQQWLTTGAYSKPGAAGGPVCRLAEVPVFRKETKAKCQKASWAMAEKTKAPENILWTLKFTYVTSLLLRSIQ